MLSYFLFMFSFAASAHSQQSGVHDVKASLPRSIRLTLNLNKSSYKLNEKIVAQVLITNLSKKSLYFYDNLDWGESASISLWLVDKSSKKQIVPSVINDTISLPPNSEMDFVKILPMHIFGVTIETDLSELGATKAGAYELVAKYHSPVPKNMNFGLHIVSREDGVVSSNIVPLLITQ